MITRLLIVLLITIGIIFVPYFIGNLIIPRSTLDFGDTLARWWLGFLVCLLLSICISFLIVLILPWIING